MEAGLKQVLMITYYFPPIGGAGVYRSLKFCKYLPNFGWQPTVVAGHRQDPDFAPDETLLAQIPPQAVVHRIDFPWQSPWRRTRRWLFAHRLGRLGHHLGFFFDFPCRFREWAQRAVDCALQTAEAVKPDLVYTSAPPFSAHLVGLEIKRRLGVPWVADFRDPWTDNAILMDGLPRWQMARHRRLERRVANAADHCLFAHPLAGEMFRKRYQLPPERVVGLTNGYDLADFECLPAQPPPVGERFNLVYTGSFYASYSPEPLRQALELSRRMQPGLLRRLRLVFVGGCPIRFDNLPGLEVEVLPRVAQREAQAWMARAHVLLIVNPGAEARYAISGKLFEYLAVRRPILGIVPLEGASAEILRETGAGFVANPGQPEEILTALQACMRAVQDPASFPYNPAAVTPYARLALTRRLAELFNASVAETGPR